MSSSALRQACVCPPSAATAIRREHVAARSPLQHGQLRGRQRRGAGPAAATHAVLADAALAVQDAAGGGLQPWLLPAVGVGLAVAGVAALRLTSYSQLEYVTAAMLSRHVKPGGARVLQLGGTTRDVFYYPAGTVQVTVGGPELKIAVWEQAGMQAKVPVAVVKQDVQKLLSSQAGSVVDSVVMVNRMAQWADPQQLLSQVHRVLKPGGTFIFIQRLRGGAPLQALLGGSADAVDAAVLEAVQQYGGWDFVQWDQALEGTDPHAVGVAIKPLTAAGGHGVGADGSVDTVAFEQIMRRNKGRQQAQQQGGGFGGE